MSVQVPQVEVTNPRASFSQEEMLRLLGLDGDEFAERIFARCGVKKRHLAAAVGKGLLETTLQHRVHETEEQLLRMSVRAVDALDVDPAEIGVVITSNYYSLGGPTLAHRLVAHYDMDPTTDKYHVLGVGCASAVPLFKLAGQALRDQPGKSALVVAAESITGFIQPVNGHEHRTKVVSASLFGDGCAAALLTAPDGSRRGPSVVASQVHQVGNTLDTVAFKLATDDSYMQIGAELPEIAEKQLDQLVDGFLGAQDLERAAVDHWLVHPGGRGILEGVQRGLSLSDEDVAVSYGVLADYGNMGTPSSFYVLKRTQEEREPASGDTGLMVTIGPGVTVGLMLLRW
jgi:alkylresorcinol/alkylpyrone synthase